VIWDGLFERLGFSLVEIPAIIIGRVVNQILSPLYYRFQRNFPIEDAVLLSSFDGKQFSDSPKAILGELQRRDLQLSYYCTAAKGLEIDTPGAKTVQFGSRIYIELLARARYVVTNSHLPPFVKRRKRQVIVQTWHGTPLKKLVNDVHRSDLVWRALIKNVAKEVPAWSVLVSPNSFSTAAFRSAFGYSGKVLESGYPRNDYLYRKDKREITAKVREELDLPPNRKIILYAPTFRENKRYGPGRYAYDSPIDFTALKRALSEEYVLLVRNHYYVVDGVPGAGDGFVWDVSQYPNLEELLVAADILITDYSSLMFDYAHLGRPMLFFTYDLAEYRDNLRGFYFDFEHEAPGPLIGDTPELVQAIKNIDVVIAAYRDRFDRFREKFTELDDGNAAERVVDEMLKLGRHVD